MERYNPLDKRNLGASVASALLARPVAPLPNPAPRTPIDEAFNGAGIYAIYYTGERCPYPPYEPVATANRGGAYQRPIYVGKAVPEGARKAGIGLDIEPGPALFRRLRDHARSIHDADNLDLTDFACRYLVVDDIWIPLGESLVIQRFRPVWNLLVDGFGNHDPGGGRYNQQRSRWDTIHPGRSWATRLTQLNPMNPNQIELEIERFLAGQPVASMTVEQALQTED